VSGDPQILPGTGRGSARRSGVVEGARLQPQRPVESPLHRPADGPPPRFGENVKSDFPGLVTAEGKPWHYLDTAATAQKPQAVIDATVGRCTVVFGRKFPHHWVNMLECI